MPPNHRHWSRSCAEVVADVRGRRHADRDRRRVAPRLLRGPPHGADRPLGDVGVGELEDEPVADLAGQRERLGSVRGHPHLEPAPGAHGNRSVAAPYVTSRPFASSRITWTASPSSAERRRPPVDHAHGRVAAADAEHGAVAEHLVQGGEQRCGDRPVAGAGFVTIGPTVTRARLGEDLRCRSTYGSSHSRCESNVHTWLNPAVSASLREVHDPRRRRVACRTTPMSIGSSWPSP